MAKGPVDILKPITDAVAVLGKLLKEITPTFTKLVDQFTIFGKTLSASLGQVFGTVVDLFKSFKDVVGDVLSPLQYVKDKLSSFAKDAFSGIIHGIISLGGALKDMLPPGIQDAIKGVADYFGNIGKAISTSFQSALSHITEYFGKVGSAIVGMIPPGILDAIKGVADYFGNIGKAISTSFQSGTLSHITEYFGKVGSAIFGALKVVTGALAGIASAAGGVLSAVIGLGEAMANFIKLANPAVLNIFMTALEDMQAIIGQALAPVMEAITPIIRLAADTFATFASGIGSAIGDMISAFMPILKELFDFYGREGQVVAQIFQAFTPVVQLIADVFNQLVKAAEPIQGLLLDIIGNLVIVQVQILAEVLRAVTPLIIQAAEAVKSFAEEIAAFVRELFGIRLLSVRGGGTAPNASLGAAVKSVSIGSQESVIQAAHKSAFTLGTAASKKPEERTADATSEMAVGIKTMIEKFLSLPADIAGRLATLLKPLFDKIWDRNLKDTAGPGIEGSGKTSGSSTMDDVLAAFSRYGGWLDRHIAGTGDR